MKKKGLEEWESSYRDFIKKHDKFLRKHPDADALQRRRPLQFLEEVGIECALPSLYWCSERDDGDPGASHGCQTAPAPRW